MKSNWFELVLVALSAVVLTLLCICAWDTFKAWRINREYGPDRRQGDRRQRNLGRLARQNLGEENRRAND